MGFDFDPLAAHRREYGERALDEYTMSDSPFVVFESWLAEALAQQSDILDPTAMVLSTVDSMGRPNARVVLLKGIEDGAFIFYTNYESTKASELEANPYAALNFFWPTLVRQVRIRGEVRRVSRETSEAYFSTRSLMSQCSAIVSPQSQAIDSRQMLVDAAKNLFEKHTAEKNTPLPCPIYWGGFAVFPDEFEFWQGRDHRLHDRVVYSKKNASWKKTRLAS